MFKNKKIKIYLILIIFFIVFNFIPVKAQYSGDWGVIKEAIEKKDINLCNDLGIEAKDQCFFFFANSSSDQRFCDHIIDSELKTQCLETLSSQMAIANKNLNQCMAITADNLKQNCLIGILQQQTDLKFCDSLVAVQKVLCQDLIYTNLAINYNDITLCNQIMDENYKTNCQISLKNLPQDSDQDGLLDIEEISYGLNPFAVDSDNDNLGDLAEIRQYKTDPVNKDTDNDSIDDDQEIRLGTNPLIKDQIIPKTAKQSDKDYFKQLKNNLIIVLFIGGIIVLFLLVILFFLKRKIKIW